MRFDRSNVARDTVVADIEGRKRLDHVLSIDTDTHEVECAHWPIEVSAGGDISTYKARFSAIHPIYGGRALPCAFHCYGPLG